MKLQISRQIIYMLALAVVFILIIFIFAFAFLIPAGKEYRVARLELKKLSYHVDIIGNEYNKIYNNLKELQTDNRHIITAYKSIFNPERFVKVNQSYFKSFKLSQLSAYSEEEEFAVYEVNTSSLIQSPQGFYDFLDGVNKSDYIIGVNFPIDFKRDGNLIKSSFTMHVYIANAKKNKEAVVVEK